MVSYSQTSDFKTHNKDFLARKPTEIIFGKQKKYIIRKTFANNFIHVASRNYYSNRRETFVNY